MSKQITAAELAEIITGLLTMPDELGELGEFFTFRNFMTDIASVVCSYCGGYLADRADVFEDTWYVGVADDGGLPPGGGVWEPYDQEGEL
jgi:hypothetical protein